MYDVTAIKAEEHTPLTANAPLADAHEVAKHAAASARWDRVEVREAGSGIVVATHQAPQVSEETLAAVRHRDGSDRNIFTDMAIDAFRRQEQARRRLARAEDATLKAARLVPRGELAVYFEQTEKIRIEMDSADEREYQRTGSPVSW